MSAPVNEYGRPLEVVSHNSRTGATYFKNPHPHLRRRPIARPKPYSGERTSYSTLREFPQGSQSSTKYERIPEYRETSFGGHTTSTQRLLPVRTPGIGSIASTITPAQGLIGGAAGTLLGGILSTSGSGITLKGTPHIGPGNTLDQGPARNEADQIARDHDIQYRDIIDQANQENWSAETFRAYIADADAVAIESFKKSYQNDPRWQAKVAEYGLRIKQTLEKLFGQLYPRYQGKYETSGASSQRKAKLAQIKRRSKALRLGTIQIGTSKTRCYF